MQHAAAGGQLRLVTYFHRSQIRSIGSPIIAVSAIFSIVTGTGGQEDMTITLLLGVEGSCCRGAGPDPVKVWHQPHLLPRPRPRLGVAPRVARERHEARSRAARELRSEACYHLQRCLPRPRSWPWWRARWWPGAGWPGRRWSWGAAAGWRPWRSRSCPAARGWAGPGAGGRYTAAPPPATWC